MEPNNPNQSDQKQSPTPQSTPLVQPNQNGAEVFEQPYFLRDEPVIPPPARTHSYKRLVIVAGALLVVFGLLTVAAIVSKKSSIASTASQTTTAPLISLKTQTVDGIQFSYPDTWDSIDGTSLGFSLAFGSDETASQSGTAVYYGKQQIMDSAVAVSDFNATAKKSITDSAVAAFTTASNAKGCTGFALASQTAVDEPTYFGEDVISSCSANSNGVPTTEIDRFIYVGDGNLYRVSLTSLTANWKENSQFLKQLITQVLPV